MNERLKSNEGLGKQMLESSRYPVMSLNMDGNYDAEAQMASQILASFRNTWLQKERAIQTKDLKPVYHTNTGDQQVVPPNRLTDNVYIDLDTKSEEDLTESFDPNLVPKQEFPSLTSDVQLSANYFETPVSHGAWSSDQSQISELHYTQDPTAVVSSSIDGEIYAAMTGSYGEKTSQTSDRKMDRAYQNKNYELPPCRVCGFKASGFHYGANTCEACKGFFRRSLKKANLEYKCLVGNNDCQIQKGRRNNCPLCRYNKCLEVGMSKDAIKTGRYTHEKRTKDIIEVKGLRESPLKDEHLDVSLPIKEESRLGEEHQLLIDKIYQSHRQLLPFWHITLESGVLPRKFKEYSESFLLKQKEGLWKSPIEESEPKFTDTKDPNKTMDLLTKHLELVIMTFVKFAKSIPGFCDLPLNDQATLVKTSRFEVWMIGAHKFVSPEHSVVIGPRGNAFHAIELNQVLEEEFVKKLFEFSATLQKINLTNEETAMLKCVVLTFSDRCDLEEPSKVDAIQLNLVSCLQAQLKSSRRFSQVMNALVGLRDLTEWNNRISQNLLMEWPTIQHNPLLMEVMAI